MKNARITVYPVAGGYMVDGTMYNAEGDTLTFEAEYPTIDEARVFLRDYREVDNLEFSVEWHNCSATDEPKKIGSGLMAFLYPNEFVEA
jgi:hypothetical protein